MKMAPWITTLLTFFVFSALGQSVDRFEVRCRSALSLESSIKGRITTKKVFQFVTEKSICRSGDCKQSMRRYGVFSMSGLQICGELQKRGACTGENTEVGVLPFEVKITCSGEFPAEASLSIDETGVGSFKCLKSGELLGQDEVGNCRFL